MQNSKKVLAALSGGVDSSVCVHLLKQKGYDVAGLVLKMSPAHEETVQAAKQAASALSVPLFVKDMQGAFEQNVVSYFIDEYRRGRTPNPCVVCNPTVKFRALLDAADEHGYEYIATGHYAKITQEDGLFYLEKGENLKRDQSYMLYRLGQDVLSRLLLPLAALPKPQVREIARTIGLSCADKPDSQEICFIPDGNYAGYIEARLGKSPQGEFISPEGEACGTHQGIIHYTVGQRKHLGIALGKPVFIRSIDPDSNRIYLAWGGGEYAGSVEISGVCSVTGLPFPDHFSCQVKIRSMASPAGAQAFLLPNGRLNVVFDEPQRAPAKGQSLVLYDGNRVLGGGFIESELGAER